MTPNYIVNEMSWNEVNDSLAYIALKESIAWKYATKQFKKIKHISDWFIKKNDTTNEDFKKMLADMKKAGAK